MSTNIEPLVAQDEKSKFFIFLPEIAFAQPSNVVRFCLENFFKPNKKTQICYSPKSGQKNAKFSDQYLNYHKLHSAKSAS